MQELANNAEDIWCSAWLGRVQLLSATLEDAPVRALAATLDRPTPEIGNALPAGWQWLFFNPVAPQRQLGNDGHPLRTPDSFLPPLPLPRRMWAGSRIRYLAPLLVGARASRTSRIVRITPKSGKTGQMCFVTVEHRISSGGQECVVEEQDIVYREASSSAAPIESGPFEAARVRTSWQRLVTPDPVMLFRYSALTFNGHRIHYDLSYARDVEHYADLVVHGPLTATLLQNVAQEFMPGRQLAAFEFKGLLPLFVNRPVVLTAVLGSANTMSLEAVAPSGHCAMQAVAEFEPQE